MPMEPAGNGTSNGLKPKWAPILGRWEISEAGQRFLGEGMNGAAHGQMFPVGLAISNVAIPQSSLIPKLSSLAPSAQSRA